MQYTDKQTKEWLKRARQADYEIDCLIFERKKIFEAATKSTKVASPDNVQVSGGNSSEELFLKYAEYSELINTRIDELINVKKEIINVIAQINDGQLRALLIARYINFKKWETIADELHYSYTHIMQRLYPRAISATAAVLSRNSILS